MTKAEIATFLLQCSLGEASFLCLASLTAQPAAGVLWLLHETNFLATYSHGLVLIKAAI